MEFKKKHPFFKLLQKDYVSMAIIMTICISQNKNIQLNKKNNYNKFNNFLNHELNFKAI